LKPTFLFLKGDSADLARPALKRKKPEFSPTLKKKEPGLEPPAKGRVH
jgi:origin recognition complex subunit 6